MDVAARCLLGAVGFEMMMHRDTVLSFLRFVSWDCMPKRRWCLALLLYWLDKVCSLRLRILSIEAAF
jgi:hypothetical protein